MRQAGVLRSRSADSAFQHVLPRDFASHPEEDVDALETPVQGLSESDFGLSETEGKRRVDEEVGEDDIAESAALALYAAIQSVEQISPVRV